MKRKRLKGKIYIGTSGWIYWSWEGIFYPEGLISKEKLKYFSQHFKTTEINYSFYHLPQPSTYQKWYSETPADFIFSVKVSRFITHIKRLKEIREAWKKFIENALNLKEKLGSLLLQFPASFKANPENLKRLEEFLRQNKRKNLRLAFEFRDKSFCDEKVYNLLRKYNSSWVMADSSRYPKAEEVTADFVYIRLHGPEELFASRYSKKQMKELALKIKKWISDGFDVYVYFNNDVYGYAIENAKELLFYLR